MSPNFLNLNLLQKKQTLQMLQKKNINYKYYHMSSWFIVAF